MQLYLDGIIEQFKPVAMQGKVASYIPELEKTNKDLLGITLIDTTGTIYESGDTMHLFTIQSISKPIVLLLALIDNGEERVFEKVGKEPTGDPFNSIVRLETFDEHKPLNPMINAGAISVTALIKGSTMEEKIERILSFIKKITHNQNIKVNEAVYQSESKTGYRNRSMAYFLKDFGNIEGDVDEVLEIYFKQCSIEVTTRDLAYIGALLARDGVDIVTGERIFSARYSRIVKSYMATCGMYDGSGEFAINVGFPAKSGVGGGIMCTVLGQMGIGVFGPALDRKGNSIAGLKLLESLSKKLELSIY
ncbi:glutaminase A [Fusibacter bizertensis]